MNGEYLEKEDYEEPCCPFSKPNQAESVPVGRIIDKLDDYLGQNAYEDAERHLLYWFREAQNVGDLRGELTILNEQVGLYRKLLKKEEGLKAIQDALNLAESLGMDDTISMGTTLVNCATGLKAFDEPWEAISLYRKAKLIYESHLSMTDDRLAGLYNNMAITLMGLQEFTESKELFNKALDIMHRQEHGEPEMAITHLNLADLVLAEQGKTEGANQVLYHLKEAERLLDIKTIPQDGNYAYVCEKCAAVFGSYGLLSLEKKLLERAENIYERS